jgi:hypothetical protein
MQKTELTATQQEESAFRQKAGSYLVCFIDSCPLREECLRWLVGQYADTTPMALTAVNPRNPQIGGDGCIMFRRKERAVMKRGFTRLYREMPTYMEQNIRQMLIAIFTRKKYFEMRRGDRLITPEQQQDILDVCRRYGWTGPIAYDGEAEDWLW